MSLLIRQAKIISPGNTLHNKTMDILVEGGTIKEIKKSISVRNNIKEIIEPGLCVSVGWIDLQVAACDPGFEHKEDLDSLVRSAASGGFTKICLHSHNQPALHNKTQIEYLINKTRNKIVSVIPFGSITVDNKGKDLAEMYDMQQAGAIAFSDYKHAIKDAGMVMRALQYSSNINSSVVTYCNEESISHGGQMNEGEVSTSLGLKGIPSLAEELMLERNLSILEYSGGKLHVPTISTKGSVELIKKAKSAGLNVTCSVSSTHLLLDDNSLKEFDTNYKLDPPLRTKKDIQALRTGVENGIIDAIVSDHLPQDSESKELEFDLADSGIINLQTSFASALEAMKEKSIDSIISALTKGPAHVIGLQLPEIKEGEDANLTLFSLNQTTELNEKNNLSKSKNSPFFGKTLQGKVIGIINGGKSYFNV